MKTSNKLIRWMKDWYHFSSDKNNPDSNYSEEFRELRCIVDEIKVLEKGVGK